MSTIREVAERSGVSVATVSRVFNDYPDVSEATRERVLAAARELEYAPSAAARTLVGRRSQLIGVGLFTGFEHPDIDHPFFQDVLVGLKHGVGARGYDVLLFATEQPGAYLRRARHHRVDGVVLWGVDGKDPELPALVAAGIPLVTVDLVVEGPHATWVTSDSVAGARLAVRHLYDLGHRRIATIAGLPSTKPGGDRLLGYREETAALGLEPLEREGDFYAESGEVALRELLALPERPTAVFAASDLMAFGAIKAALAAGLRVPTDLSVVGFDDIGASQLAHPRLTTIRHDKVGLGLAAAQALVDEIENPARRPPPPVTLPVELVVRESTTRAASP